MVDDSPLEMKSKHPPWRSNLNQPQPHSRSPSEVQGLAVVRSHAGLPISRVGGEKSMAETKRKHPEFSTSHLWGTAAPQSCPVLSVRPCPMMGKELMALHLWLWQHLLSCGDTVEYNGSSGDSTQPGTKSRRGLQSPLTSTSPWACNGTEEAQGCFQTGCAGPYNSFLPNHSATFTCGQEGDRVCSQPMAVCQALSGYG